MVPYFWGPTTHLTHLEKLTKYRSYIARQALSLTSKLAYVWLSSEIELWQTPRQMVAPRLRKTRTTFNTAGNELYNKECDPSASETSSTQGFSKMSGRFPDHSNKESNSFKGPYFMFVIMFPSSSRESSFWITLLPEGSISYTPPKTTLEFHWSQKASCIIFHTIT